MGMINNEGFAGLEGGLDECFEIRVVTVIVGITRGISISVERGRRPSSPATASRYRASGNAISDPVFV